MKYRKYDCDVAGACWRRKWMVDYEPIEDCFEGKVRPSDGDMIVERKGHVLYVEFKPLDEMERGLHYAHSRLLRTLAAAPRFTVIVVYLEDGLHIEKVRYVRKATPDRIMPPKATSFAELRAALERWDAKARGGNQQP